MNKEIIIKKEHIVPVFNNRFLNVYDIQYKEGKHYYKGD